MRTFAYRQWDSEYVFVGDWPEQLAGEPAGAAEARLSHLHEQLWSESPPQLRPTAVLGELAGLDHPLARALVLMYRTAERPLAPVRRSPFARSAAEPVRQVALRALQEPPIAHVEAEALPAVLARGALSAVDGAYVRWMALSALRELAQPADAPLLARWLGPNESAAEPTVEAPELAAERAEAVWALAALIDREPALLAETALADRLLALAQADRSPVVRIAAMQALMASCPSPRVSAALRRVAETEAGAGAAAEPAWAAAIALFQSQPAAHAGLLLAVHRRTPPPTEYDELFTQLALLAEEAALRVALWRPGAGEPFIWRDPDGTVFALCQPDGSAPPGAEDPRLGEIAKGWQSAPDRLRSELLARLADCQHAAGRAVAILAGPVPEEDPDAYADDLEDGAELDEAGLDAAGLDAAGSDAERHADEADSPAAASPPALDLPAPAVDWLELSRAVLADPPLTRLVAADVQALVTRALGSDLGAASAAAGCPAGPPAVIGQRACNHCAALKALGELAEARDGAALESCFLRAGPGDNQVAEAALQALYWQYQRRRRSPSDPATLTSVSVLARAGASEKDGELRRAAVQLLGCWPAAVTRPLLRELTQDPTYSVCCVAERALAEQSFADPDSQPALPAAE